MHNLRQGLELGRGRVGREIITADHKHTSGSSGVSGMDKRGTTATHKCSAQNPAE